MVVPKAMGNIRIKYRTQIKTIMSPRVERTEAAISQVRFILALSVSGECIESVLVKQSMIGQWAEHRDTYLRIVSWCSCFCFDSAECCTLCSSICRLFEAATRTESRSSRSRWPNWTSWTRWAFCQSYSTLPPRTGRQCWSTFGHSSRYCDSSHRLCYFSVRFAGDNCRSTIRRAVHSNHCCTCSKQTSILNYLKL